MAMAWEGQAFLDLVIFALTVWKSIELMSLRKAGGWGFGNITDIILRDGMSLSLFA